MSTFRVAFLLAVSSVLIVVAALSFPTGSRAKVQSAQKAVSKKQVRRQSFVPGEIIVRYRNESMAKSRAGAMRVTAQDGQLRSMRVDDFEGSKLIPGLRVARVTDGGDTMSAVEALRSQPDVLYAEPNYIMHADVTPNDPHFVAGRQDNMNLIGAPQAWNTQTGSASIVVGVIDQGIDINHSDLAANIWTNPAPGAVGGGITGDVHGYNFVDNNGAVFSGADSETHASHVAGIIGAVGNNNRGVAGVNWSTSLMSLKFLDADGFGDTVNAIRACTYAKQMRDLWESSNHTKGANLRVLNASFGGAQFSTGFSDAIQALNTSGVLFVAAAGNVDDGTREPNNDLVPHYPSNFSAPNIISVAASNSSDVLAGFSHFGTTVHLAAPGVSVLSTTPPCLNPGTGDCLPDFTDANSDTYSIFSGTSMAAPHVSGAAALLWAQNPNLSVAQVKSLLILNGDVRAPLLDKTLTGRRLNVGNSLQSLLENDSTPPGAVTNMRIDSQNGRSFNLGWTASGDDGVNGQAALYQLSFTDPVSLVTTPLAGEIPMPSGSGQIASVTIPYRHTSGTLTLQEFDNAGNAGTPVSVPVVVPQSAADPYVPSTGTAQPLSTGGDNLNPNADDRYVDVLFPTGFRFPFFGQIFDTVTVSTNGILYFGGNPPQRDNGDADDVPSSPGKLGGYPAIAGLWDDLDLRTSRRADAGIFQIISPGKVIFRWQGVPCAFDGNACTGTVPVNFEIELNSNGVIKTRYGSGNTGLFPTVGIAGGEHDPYIIADHTNEETPISLTNAAEVTFTPRAQTVSTIQFTQAAFSANENTGSMNVTVSRTGDTSSVATVSYATSDAAGNAACSAIGTTASSRCDYLTTGGTLTFAAGDTSKTVSIPIIDDVYTENPENFTLTLSNSTGATLGATTTATLTINDGAAEGAANPIDTPGFFVRQHYVDFLNREPDAGGLAFWTNEITSCNGNAQCIDVKRINVSAAFFLSIEFQETGYLVYRINKSALGNLPNAPVPVAFTPFLRDTQQIGQGVQVGIGDWQNKLEANKQAFTLAYVQRPEFLAAYPNSMTAAQIVDKMNTNAGGILSATERTNLINLLGVTPSDLSRRAAVLRAVAEDPDLKTAEFNKAFVLMQYFGYLRRSPNEFPDSDFSGFNFWLTKLNQFNGNFADAEMVKAFITSIEYRQRFAP
ncbi:MAG TPA: S8 family serine peptidase [Pyrinomonadaceae bacterium]|nr:S8 family serine peptidase [Pyrinomonadaceae bacterium]